MRHKGVDSFPRIYVVNEWMRTITKLNQLCKSVLQILQSHSVLFFTRSFFASSSLSTAIASVIYILILRTPESKDFSKISSYFHLQFPPWFSAQRAGDITITLYIVVLGGIAQRELELRLPGWELSLISWENLC